MQRLAITVLLLSTAAAAAEPAPPGSPAARTERRFAELKKSPPELYAFLNRMPKGGDLHNHLSGAVYAETYLRVGAEDKLCVNLSAMAFAACTPGTSPVENARTNIDFANTLINAFSMRNFVPGKESGHDHFFATFAKFGGTDNSHEGEFVAEVARRAADQNESYLELMALSGSAASKLAAKAPLDAGFDAARAKLMAAGLDQAVAVLRARLDRIEEGRKQTLGCAAAPASAPCQVQVNYVYQVLREMPQPEIFAQVMTGFALAAADPRVVGVNFVQAEDGLYSMRDYHAQMQMVDYAHKLYPSVHITLHAGELAPGLVPPEGLLFHIRDAVETGHAERIGHGVDIMYETGAENLLNEMRDRHILVEINLTSNEGILGVSGGNHPLPVYRKYRVPVALSTDDEGVSRSNLTLEYLRAVLTYNLTYSDLKEMARNSIEYSFADKNQKARLTLDLTQRFARFEKDVSH
jgi:adenosine deaminase